MEMSKELISKAESAKGPEELLAMAKENGIELTEASAQEYFMRLHPQAGELEDDELDGVAGGGCSKTDTPYRRYVSPSGQCSMWICRRDGSKKPRMSSGNECGSCHAKIMCGTCKRSKHEGGKLVCLRDAQWSGGRSGSADWSD